MAVRFITLTTRSGKIRVNPDHIVTLQDIGAGHPGDVQTNVLAGQTLFVMETVDEIMEACGHGKTDAPVLASPPPLSPEEYLAAIAKQEPLIVAAPHARKRVRKQRDPFDAYEKRNRKAARALEELSRSRAAAAAGQTGEGGEEGGSGTD